MTWEVAFELFEQIHNTPVNSALGEKLRSDLVDRAIRYARIRTDWQVSKTKNRADIDQARTIAHNALIDAANILSRAMRNEGLSSSWREQLGNDRRKLGDFACFLHCILGLAAR